MKKQTENNSNMDMKNFLCPLRRLSPTAPANSAAKTAASDTLTRSGQTQQPRRKFSNDPLFGVIFSFVLFQYVNGEIRENFLNERLSE